jgi:hypothetical protein
MSTTRKKFVSSCEKIIKAKPKYELGCSSLSKCDCIGMVKYGLRQNGVTLTTTGTNWTFRNQVCEIRNITDAGSLRFGDLVFKFRSPGESGYNLPSKYRKGGSAYNGDLNDYCHVGVVKSVSPLRIIHMTSPTAKTDTTIGKWRRACSMTEKYISGSAPAPSPPEPPPYTSEAIVTAPSGLWVKMRKEPSTSCRLWENVPVGAKVTIVTNGYEWTKINYGRYKGWYMMTKFLKGVDSVA